jgi:hypothetical protein
VGAGWHSSLPFHKVHSCLGLGEGLELMTQGSQPVVRRSHPADSNCGPRVRCPPVA